MATCFNPDSVVKLSPAEDDQISVGLEWDYDIVVHCQKQLELHPSGTRYTWSINVSEGMRTRVAVRDVAGKTAVTEDASIWLRRPLTPWMMKTR